MISTYIFTGDFMYGYIYKTTNTLNNKIYIGQKKSPNFLGNRYLGSGKRLKLAIEKYGIDVFTIVMIDTAEDRESLNQKEIYWIEKLNSMNPDVGYNLSKGGDGYFYGEPWNKGLTKETEPRLKQSAEARLKRGQSLKAAYREGRRSPIKGGWKCPERTAEMNEQNSQRQQGKRWMILVENNQIIDSRCVLKEFIQTYLDKGYIFGRKPYNFVNPNKGKTKETDPKLMCQSLKAKKRIKEFGHQGYFGLKGKDHPRSTYNEALKIANTDFYNYWNTYGKEDTIKHYNISRSVYAHCCEILNIIESREHKARVRKNLKNRCI